MVFKICEQRMPLFVTGLFCTKIIWSLLPCQDDNKSDFCVKKSPGTINHPLYSQKQCGKTKFCSCDHFHRLHRQINRLAFPTSMFTGKESANLRLTVTASI